jgi:choline-sulfatase
VSTLPEMPNVILIITDQERVPMHFPAGFAEERLRTRARLLRHGVSFDSAVCNTAMCSPSRATFLTGLMPSGHGVVDTLTEDGPFSAGETELSREIPNLATMLRAAGYDVQYRGKWHLSKGAAGAFDSTAEDLAGYGFDGWVAPDAGGDTEPPNFGGGRADHDARYIEQSVEFLRERAAGGGRPFCLVISLVNPHDLLAYPHQWENDYSAADLEGDIGLPETTGEDLRTNLKPSAHAAMVPAIDMAVGTLGDDAERLRYVNFYANLVEKIDRQLAPIVDCLYTDDGEPTLLGRDTVVVRFSDHGELGLAHGGLRQKAFNVYEETLRVPLIFSNPALVPEGASCAHPASLVDIVPTVLGLLGVDVPAELHGADLSPLVRDPGAEPVQDEVPFTFDDMHAGTGRVPELLPGIPGRIRCIRERRFKYARYFNDDAAVAPEYEMYDLQDDPLELENLAHPDHPRYDEPGVRAERERLAARLAAVEARLA